MANSAKDIQMRELRDTIAQLNELVKTLQETLKQVNALNTQVTQERDNLKEQVDYLTKKLFGTSSEKRSHDIPGQLEMFNEAEQLQDPVLAKEEDAEAAAPVPKKRRSRATDEERYKGIRVEKVYLDVPDDQKTCSVCGTQMKAIGTEFVRRELDFIPAKVKVVEYYTINYACPSCKENSAAAQIERGKDYHPRLMHGMASPAVIAWTMYQKYSNSVPLYRQEKDWAQYGAKIGRATLANWIIRNAEDFFTPMYDYVHRKLLCRRFLMADETPVQVLHEPDRRPQAKSYMWLFRTGEDDGPPLILYHYSETRAGDTAVNFLEGFRGYLMCDGYSGYNKVQNATRVSCWAHVRRYLLDAIPKEKAYDYSLPAVQGVMYVNKLFDYERDIHEKYSSPDAIKEARLRKEKPVLEGFWAWVDAQRPTRNSRLDKALIYIRNRKPYLETYLEDGRCSFSNNASERAVKDFVIGRKNWLFSDTPEGAVASSMVYSIVAMAKANGVNVYHYLRFLLEHHPNKQMADEELESLAPWNEAVKSEIQRRADS